MEYVYTGPATQGQNFRKRKEPTGNCFTPANEPANHFYESVETIVSRFLRRMNGKDLLLCEVATGYEYLGPNKSEELFEVYKNKIASSDRISTQCVKIS